VTGDRNPTSIPLSNSTACGSPAIDAEELLHEGLAAIDAHLRVRAIGADAGGNVVATGGAAEWVPESPLPSVGRVACRDVATGLRAEVSLARKR
jgi:hypothetical protein